MSGWAPPSPFGSDYFDDVLARRFGEDGAGVRRFDNATDAIFFVCAAWSAWSVHADLLRPYLWVVGAIVALEITRYALDFAQFGREASYHAWSAKAWGLTLFVALIALMDFGRASPFVALALGAGVVADVEGLAISLVLPVWTHDVKSVWHAWRIQSGWRPGA